MKNAHETTWNCYTLEDHSEVEAHLLSFLFAGLKNDAVAVTWRGSAVR